MSSNDTFAQLFTDSTSCTANCTSQIGPTTPKLASARGVSHTHAVVSRFKLMEREGFLGGHIGTIIIELTCIHFLHLLVFVLQLLPLERLLLAFDCLLKDFRHEGRGLDEVCHDPHGF